MDEQEKLEAARNVLWFFGDYGLGWEPGGFTSKLMSAISAADMTNRARLAIVFPHLVTMFNQVQHTEAGLDELRDLVKAAVA